MSEPTVNLLKIARGETEVLQWRGLTVMIGHEGGAWHMSISHPKRNPTYDEIKEARYLFCPDSVNMAMIFPPKSEFVNIHEHCFHLWQV